MTPDQADELIRRISRCRLTAVAKEFARENDELDRAAFAAVVEMICELTVYDTQSRVL